MSMKEFFEDVFDGNFDHAGERLKDFGETDLASFKSGVLTLVDGLEQSGGATLWDSAMNAVQSEEPQDKTNEEKHASAREAILATLINAGVTAITSIVDIVIKLAVKKMKEALA